MDNTEIAQLRCELWNITKVLKMVGPDIPTERRVQMEARIKEIEALIGPLE